MKFLLFCVLAGLSLADDDKGTGCKEPSKPKGVNECVNDALFHTDGFLKNFAIVFCYYKNKEKANDENIKAAGAEFTKALCRFGCPPDELVGKGNTFKDALTHIGDAYDPLGFAVDKALQALGIGEDVGNLVCSLLRGTLAGECADKLLKGDLPGLIPTVKALLCKNIDKLTGKELLEILIHLACVGKDVLKMDNKLMDKICKEFSEELRGTVKELTKSLKGDALGQSLLPELGCTAVDKATSDLLDGGASSLLGGKSIV